MLSRMIDKLRRMVLAQRLAGKAVTCPCCNAGLVAFLPYGSPPRAHAYCPICGSLERHRLVWLYLKNETDLFSGQKTLLHVAPEGALHRKLVRTKSITYTPCDKFAPGYSYTKDTIDVDVTAIPFDDDSFDAIICNHVLEHVSDDLTAMKEFFRVLRPKGWAILQVPIDMNRTASFEDSTMVTPEQRKKAFGQSDHVRIYGSDYSDRLRQAGFEVTIDPYPERIPTRDSFRYGLNRAEKVFFCRK